MTNYNQPAGESPTPIRISREEAEKLFKGQAPADGRFTAEFLTEADAHETHRMLLEIREQRVLEERQRLEQERLRLARADEESSARAQQQRQPTTPEDAEFDFDEPPGRRADRAKAVGRIIGGLTVGLIFGTAFYYNEVLTKEELAARASIPTATARPTPSPSETLEPTPTPTPTETAIPNALVVAKDLASIQTPQPQPFKNKYPVAENGDIKGYVGYYKAGTTPEEVQWMESCGNTTEQIVLGFDDSGTEAHIREIAKVLEENNSGGIFFLNTHNKDSSNPPLSQDLVNELRNAGFYVADHSDSHPDMTKLTDEEIRQEIIAGGPANLIRLPYGATYKDENNNIYVDDRVLKVAKSTGAAVCMWSGDTLDWEEDATVESILANVERDLAPGTNYLFHVDPSYPTLKALPDAIKLIREKGHELCPRSKTPTSADFSETKICVPTES